MKVKRTTPLAKEAEKNTQVTRGTAKEQEVLKKGVPNDHSRKHLTEPGVQVVGASLGVTKNMDNYQSLRVDCWLTDTVRENETAEKAYERIFSILDETLTSAVDSYSQEE